MTTINRLRKVKVLYLMLLLPLLHLIIFYYAPMYGIVIAFKSYRPGIGIWGSSWNQFEHFAFMFSDFTFIRALRNTFIISSLKLAAGFVLPIVFALLLNELRHHLFKRTVQSLSYLPHFLSWVIAASMMVEVLSSERGIVNYAIKWFGGDPIHFLASKTFFVPILIATEVWKSVGWGSIIYLAAMAAISPELYEAAESDGANRFHKMIYITVPSLVPVMTIVLLLSLGNILNAGFDQVLNLYNPLVYEVADILDTYIYRVGLVEFRMDYSAAIGLFRNVVGVVFLVAVNQWVRRRSEYGVW